MASPLNTRPAASSRRYQQKPTLRNRDAFPDKVDIRDIPYQPSLQALPTLVNNINSVPVVLNQGQEGACTGFALAAVINFHLYRNGRFQKNEIKKDGVSPRMLYELARKYDEWPGEDYIGSSARGTIKGWNAHGVVRNLMWGNDKQNASYLNAEIGREAMKIPAGSYYRVQHRQVRDVHCALFESGILFATLNVHSGWDDLSNTKNAIWKEYKDSINNNKILKLPIIQRRGRAEDGHAIAIVGYTADGFIIQNSWGRSWGDNGFAILPYEDWMLHASDCWVVQLGVPVITNLWELGAADTIKGTQRASEAIPLERIRPYVIDVGNNGYLSDNGIYWTTEEDVHRLFDSIGEITAKWKKKRIMLYLHGGLNTEQEVARRIVAFKDVCLKNEIYPIHIMWETDFWTSLKNVVLDQFTGNDRAGGWLDKYRSGVIEIKDRTFELLAARPGTIIWDEMKENARLATEEGRAINILANAALSAWKSIQFEQQKDWELHIVGHSAGAIFTAYALNQLLRIGVPVKSVQFMAPAITISSFKKTLLPLIKEGKCPIPTLYILSDEGERDDDVWLYGKSLLYLVSNSFERKRDVPLLGMQRFVSSKANDLKVLDKEIAKLFQGINNSGWPNIVVAGEADVLKNIGPDVSRSQSHGGFDNDAATLNSVLYRILSDKPDPAFETRDLQY